MNKDHSIFNIFDEILSDIKPEKDKKEEEVHKSINNFKANNTVTKNILDDLDSFFETNLMNFDPFPKFEKIQNKLTSLEKNHHPEHDEKEELMDLKIFDNISSDIKEFNSLINNDIKFDNLRDIHEK